MTEEDRGNKPEDVDNMAPSFERDAGNDAIQEGQVLGTAKKSLRI